LLCAVSEKETSLVTSTFAQSGGIPPVEGRLTDLVWPTSSKSGSFDSARLKIQEASLTAASSPQLPLFALYRDVDLTRLLNGRLSHIAVRECGKQVLSNEEKRRFF
jgi:hypothetical protein